MSKQDKVAERIKILGMNKKTLEVLEECAKWYEAEVVFDRGETSLSDEGVQAAIRKYRRFARAIREAIRELEGRRS